MAVHKVPQDVEADDKFLGPLSFKQFLFFGGTLICGYLTFLTFTKVWPLSFVFLLPTLAFAALAFPWSKEQPTELWLASRIRFLIMPRKRIWDQTGMKDLVNVTAPVRQVHVYTDGLSQNEVETRLSALATIVDSRGWAVKNAQGPGSDRLVQNPQSSVIDEKETVVESTPDIFDDSGSSGTIARQFDDMIENSEKQHKSETLQLIENARQKSATQAQEKDLTVEKKPVKNPTDPAKEQDFWFMHNTPQQPADPSLSVFQSSTVVAPGAPSTAVQQPVAQTSAPQISEEELLETVHKKKERDALQTVGRHEKVIDPNGKQPEPASPTVENSNTSTMTATPNPDILDLAKSNDLSVETLSRQANKKGLDEGEVVISLR